VNEDGGPVERTEQAVMTADGGGVQDSRRRTLSGQVTGDLRRRLADGEWPAGTRLPGEHQLAAQYDVSRATVRTALRALESQGLTYTRHGSGTFATGGTEGIHADLRSLDSMTATIESRGAVAGVSYRHLAIEAADADQAERLEVAVGEPVLVTARSLTADGQAVAFSYDVIPERVLGPGFDVSGVAGSLYSLLERSGVEIGWAVTSVHAAAGPEIGWGPRPKDALYILLDQIHRTVADQPVAWSRTYYLEGRYGFSLIRTRP
jgi:GntR family transcriptional regulator